ncbi:MAG TPA: hypothetical protein VN645_08200 [Steroidobacteraceae bacterium]|nr:hypothetical protein [Steroidobacteraceae bacterium]
MQIQRTLQRTAVVAALFLASFATVAGSLAGGTIIAPLAPGQKSSLSFLMPPGFAADKGVWLVYDLVALAPGDDDSGQMDIQQSFEGVMTPLNSFYANFHARDMDSMKSAGTIAQRLEEVAGHREPGELMRLMGADLYAAYESVNAGKGRVLVGRVVTHLSAPGKSDAPLAISVQRAQGMQPLAMRVTAGQGELTTEFQEKAQDSWAYKAGYAAGLAFFGWLVLRFFRRRN